MSEFSKFTLNLVGTNKSLNVRVYDPSQESVTTKKEVGPIHHVHVIDRSGSMSGSLYGLIDDIQRIHDNLSDDDFFTLIWFSSANEYKTVLKGAKKSPSNKKILDGLRHTVGATCFSDPMKEVVNVIEDLKDLCDSISVTLFTDGQPCVSWSYEEEVRRVMEQVAKIAPKVLAINTVGYGNYYDQNFLRQISQASQFGIMTHSTRIEQYYNIFEENHASVSGMVNQHTEIEADKNAQILYVGPKTCKMEVGSLKQRQRSKTKNLYFVVESKSMKVNGNDMSKVPADSVTKDVVNDFVYAYAYQSYYNGLRKDALDLIVKVAGDKELADAMINAFTFDEVAACTEKLKNAAYESKFRKMGTCKADYIPADDAPCVMDLIRDMANDGVSYVPFSKHVGGYKRVTRKVTDEFDLFKREDKEVLASFDDLVYSSEKLNLSTRFLVEGNVQINPNDAKKHSLPSEIPSRIYQTHTIVKDGNLNLKQIEVELPSNSGLDSKYAGIFGKVNGNRYVADLTKLPIINHSYVKKATGIDNIFDNVVKLNKLEARQKVIKYFSEKVMEEGQTALKKVDEFAKYTAAQIEVLERHGLNSKLDYAGVNRVAPKVDNCDYYEAREIKFDLKGVSSLPKVDDVLAKRAANKITTVSLKLMNEAYDWLLTQKVDLDKRTAKTRDGLAALLKKTKSEMNEIRNELNALKLAKILTGDWFQDLKTDDKGNYFYDKNDITLLVKVDRKKVYITPEQ